MNFIQRSQVVRRKKYCFNCLARTHDDRNCNSPDNCHECGLPHHTLLHPDQRHRGPQQNVSVRERLGRRNTTANPLNHQGKNRQRDPIANQAQTRQRQRKKQKPKTSTTQPNQQLLSEAIRSLAAILCATPTTSSVA